MLRLPVNLEGAFARPGRAALLFGLLGLLAVFATVRLATFMVDETRTGASMIPFDPFFVSHSCLSSYYEGARFQREGVPNLYRRTLYEGPTGEPHFIGGLVTDPYQYPPPFLLLPRLGLAASSNFKVWRAAWFGIEGAIVALAFAGVAVWIGGPLGLRAALFALLAWTSMPTLLTLQFGNFQLAAIALAVLARIAINRGRVVAGGALLALVSVSKIFPGVLFLELVFRRRWRAALVTAAFALGWIAVARVVLGSAPFDAFLWYQLPRLASGAAFETIFAHPDAVACNHAVFGIVQKLGLIGVPGMSLGLAAVISSLYGVAVIGASFVAARAGEDRWTNALVWIALLQLASLRSPFVPDVHGQFAPLWIVTLLLARGAWRPWQTALLGLAVVLLQNIVLTTPLLPIPWLAALTLTHQLAFIGLLVWVVWRAPRLHDIPRH